MALRSDRPSCMEKKQRDVLAKQVACGFGRFEWSVWKYWFWGKLFFSGGGGGCPFEKNAEFSWIFGFFVGLKFARESEGWTQELRPKESTAQEVPSEKCRGECPPSNTKKKNWPFRNDDFSYHPQFKNWGVIWSSPPLLHWAAGARHIDDYWVSKRLGAANDKGSSTV